MEFVTMISRLLATLLSIVASLLVLTEADRISFWLRTILWHSHLLRYLEFIILLTMVRVWFSRHTCISPSWINLYLGPQNVGLWVFGGVDGVCKPFDNIMFSFLSFSTFSSSFDVSISMKSGSVMELVVHAPRSERVAIFPSLMKWADDTEEIRLKYWRKHASLDTNSPSHKFEGESMV